MTEEDAVVHLWVCARRGLEEGEMKCRMNSRANVMPAIPMTLERGEVPLRALGLRKGKDDMAEVRRQTRQKARLSLMGSGAWGQDHTV